MLTAPFIVEYQRQRKALLKFDPSLAEDDLALTDTLEGITQAPDIIAGFLRKAREDEAMAGAVVGMMSDMRERKERLLARADKRRDAALQMMDAIGLRKIEQPDFSASIRNVPPKVEITDEAALPDELCKTVRSPDRAAIKEALTHGPVAGAQLSNGASTLTIRTK